MGRKRINMCCEPKAISELFESYLLVLRSNRSQSLSSQNRNVIQSVSCFTLIAYFPRFICLSQFTHPIFLLICFSLSLLYSYLWTHFCVWLSPAPVCPWSIPPLSHCLLFLSPHFLVYLALVFLLSFVSSPGTSWISSAGSIFLFLCFLCVCDWILNFELKLIP